MSGRHRHRAGHRSRPAALVVALVAVLAGCGGGGEDTTDSSPASAPARDSTSTSPSTSAGNGGGSDVAKLSSSDARRVAEAVLTSSDPADACGRYVTLHYLKVAYGGRQGCVQAQAPGSAAASLRSFRIQQEAAQGSLLIASAVPNGGPYGGSKLTVRLVGGSRGYQVDALRSNVPVGP